METLTITKNKKIAILISGRLRVYEHFLNFLMNNDNRYDIDIFMSINDNHGDFYEEIKIKFKKYLKGFYCKEYNVPDNFKNFWYNTIEGFTNPLLIGYEKTTPAYRTLSSIYNDTKCFEMATTYADQNNFEYDVYLRFRGDIIFNDLPNFDMEKINNNILLCSNITKFPLKITNNPLGEYINGEYHFCGNIKHNGISNITCDIAYGNRKMISIYCSCYNYILEENKKYNGFLFICFEYTITTYLEDCVEFLNLKWELVDYNYRYDSRHHIGDYCRVTP